MTDDGGADGFFPGRDLYAAACDAVRGITAPEGLTSEELHQFWVCVETVAYYERKNLLCRLCGSDRDYQDDHARKLIVVGYHLGEDAKLRDAELSRWLNDEGSDEA